MSLKQRIKLNQNIYIPHKEFCLLLFSYCFPPYIRHFSDHVLPFWLLTHEEGNGKLARTKRLLDRRFSFRENLIFFQTSNHDLKRTRNVAKKIEFSPSASGLRFAFAEFNHIDAGLSAGFSNLLLPILRTAPQILYQTLLALNISHQLSGRQCDGPTQASK